MLIDDILQDGYIIWNVDPEWASINYEKGRQNLIETLNKAVVIKIDNVAEYLYTISSKEYWSLDSDFPNITPPWPIMWFEYSGAQIINSEGILKRSELSCKYGVLIYAFAAPKDNYHPNNKDKYGCHAIHFVRIQNYPITQLPFVTTYIVTDEGKFRYIADKDRKTIFNFITKDQKSIDTCLKFWNGGLYAPFLALSFIHCKNVIKVANYPPNKLQKARVKKGKLPFVRYYTLNIDPMKQTLKKEGRAEKIGLQKALHICRGHFATYTAEAPLFGRYVGTYWKPMHVRGKVQKGVVIKDYNVLPNTMGEK
jgi:hypothetical protein